MRPIRTFAVAGLTTMVAVANAQGLYRPPAPLGLDEYYLVPDSNPLTAEKVELGRRLFLDPLLSSDHRVSCASCHKPERAFSDDQALSIGVYGRRGTRNAPALVNRAYGQSFFWDGRAATLEDQVLQPIQNPVEMDLSLEELTRRLRAAPDYVAKFQGAFGEAPSAGTTAQALASFVRIQRFGDSPYDRFETGDASALSPDAQLGLKIFRGKGNCIACHVGPNFSDEQFHNTGIAWDGRRFSDNGRADVTHDSGVRGAFKTPTLREVSRTAPYMHDGSLATLKDVIEFYDRGGNRNPDLDSEIRPLHLTADEKGALQGLLRALSGSVPNGAVGEIVR